MIQSRLLSCSDWFYRLLLHFYPAAFREHFAADMAQVFRTICRDVYAESGAGGLARLWLPVLWDWTWAALYQWGLYLFKRRTELMQANPMDRSDGIQPLSRAQAGLAVLPFLLFGISSLAQKLEMIYTNPASLPLWQILIFDPFLIFNWLILVGLGISLLAGFPRWGYSYLGWAILFGWWWQSMRFYGHELGGLIWLPLLGVVLIALLVRRSIQPLRRLLAGLWQDWTLLSFSVYILYSFVFILFDENHNPYLLFLLAATTLAVSLGVWGYFRTASPLMRVFSLMGGFALTTIISIIDNATWDYRAYYGLPESTQNVNQIGIIFFVILALLMAGNGLIAHWRDRRRITSGQ